jgi:cobalamin biosynthesis protein CobW
VSRRRVAVAVVTGFLGSGKTTLLRRLLGDAPARERIAVIVNELGEVGLDGRVLSGFEHVENVVELSSGCICCSIDEYRFDLAIDELLRRLDPTLLVLETTGVADPSPTLERLRRSGLGVDAVTTVVDAAAWARAWRLGGVARRQVAAADFLVVTKSDLVGTRALARLRRRLEAANPRALVLHADRGRLREEGGADLLLATSAARLAKATESDPAALSAAAAHLEAEGIESFAWRSADALDRDAFETVLASLPRDVLRAKGWLRPSTGGPPLLFQFVCGRSELDVLETRGGASVLQGGAEAVFIGHGLRARRESLVAALEECRRPRAAGAQAPRRPLAG